MTRLVNSKRGEVALTLDGKEHTLRYTYGAFEELREFFDVVLLEDVFGRFQKMQPRDLPAFLTVGLKRGSWKEATVEVVEELMTLDETDTYISVLQVAFNVSTTGSKKGFKGKKADGPERPLG